jgi:dTDP-4-amino-4,6-dideoxygalactose transaminase
MLNSGEGGFLVTNDAEAGARAAVYAGAYEKLHHKVLRCFHGSYHVLVLAQLTWPPSTHEQHLTVPDATVFESLDLANTLPNYSLRMHAVTAAIIRPQIATINARREKYNARYNALALKLNQLAAYGLMVPPQHPGLRNNSLIAPHFLKFLLFHQN